MRTRTSVTTIVTTVLITLIILVVILSMSHDRTANMIEGIILVLALFAFAAALVRSSSEYHESNKKGLRNS